MYYYILVTLLPLCTFQIPCVALSSARSVKCVCYETPSPLFVQIRRTFYVKGKFTIFATNDEWELVNVKTALTE